MKILIAPDKFKGINTAQEISELLRNHIQKTLPTANLRLCPIADGGEGTLLSIIYVLKGKTITNSPPELFNEENGRCVTGLIDAGNFVYVTSYSSKNPVRYYPEKNKFVSVNDGGTNYPKESFSCYLSSKGDTLFSDYNRGVRIFNKEGMLQNDSLGQVFGMSDDKRGNVWLAAWSYANMDLKGGIFRFDGKTFRNYKTAFGITGESDSIRSCGKKIVRPSGNI